MPRRADGNLAYVAVVGIIFLIWPMAYLGGQIKDDEVKQSAPANIALDADTLQFVDNVIPKLESEINNPSSNARKVGSYLTGSQATVRKLIFDLAALGPRYADYIYTKAAMDSSIAAAARIIPLGLMKDSRVHDALRSMVEEESDPNIRAMAIISLSKYKDTLDVPIFARALSDTYVVLMETDVATREGTFHEQVHLVGMVAVPALYELGYRPEPDTINGGYKAVKIEK